MKLTDVRFWPKADMTVHDSDVRFPGNSADIRLGSPNVAF
jgi:hypothetical protein